MLATMRPQDVASSRASHGGITVVAAAAATGALEILGNWLRSWTVVR
jgi:hypothetical protein